MASRRVRIKGIANIPQRRKTDQVINDNVTEGQNDTDSKSEEIIDKHNLNAKTDSHVNTPDVIDKENENISNVNSNVEVTNVNGQVSDDFEKNEKNLINTEAEAPNTKNELPPYERDDISKNTTKDNIITSNTGMNRTVSEEITQACKVPTIRRKFLKPPICVNVLSRKSKEKIEEAKAEPNKENVQESANINLNEIEIASNNINTSVLIQKTEPQTGPHVSKLGITKDTTKSGSDTDYQQPPASPTKILNRRIKAVPKFHQRRTSFSIGSASESEDDSRRSYSRIRNDSVCSANSGVNESNSTNEAISPTRKEFAVAPRKCRRTEQTRKFAEARREFNMKFGNGKPDKQKLTMIDLIFYNPATNPMSKKKRKRQNTTSSEISDTKSIKGDKPDEEKADDPLALSDSDNELPAPQIKVGPNGEIIVDEKSLVIENADVKKGREALQMSEIVNGDDDTSYGIYKRIRRSKEWTKEETLRFYKALNTIGTDFTIMCELFPNRTRRELKMKFKKEERLNQSLINKAVMQPTDFDMTELRKDLELEEKRAAEALKRLEEAKAIRAHALERRKNSKKMEKIKGIDNMTLPEKVVVKKTPQPLKKRKKTPYEAIKSGIDGVLSDSDEDDSLRESETTIGQNKEGEVSGNEGESDPENVSNILKPTRYGRIPKARSQDISNGDVSQLRKRTKLDLNSISDVKNREDLEPGSIMIVKSNTPADQVVYKVYIVTDNQTKQQINLSPNVIQNLTELGVDGAQAENQMCDILADNILTISAQEFPNGLDQNIESMPGSNNSEEIQLDHNYHTNTSALPSSLSNILNCSNGVEICNDSIIFPFDECLTSPTGNQNITVSHEDNKMIVVTENNKKCVLTA